VVFAEFPDGLGRRQAVTRRCATGAACASGSLAGGAGHGGGTARAKTFTTYVAGDGAVCGGWERRGSGWIGGRHAGVAWCFVFDLTSDSFRL